MYWTAQNVLAKKCSRGARRMLLPGLSLQLQKVDCVIVYRRQGKGLLLASVIGTVGSRNWPHLSKITIVVFVGDPPSPPPNMLSAFGQKKRLSEIMPHQT